MDGEKIFDIIKEKGKVKIGDKYLILPDYDTKKEKNILEFYKIKVKLHF